MRPFGLRDLILNGGAVAPTSIGSLRDLPGLLTWIDAANPLNIVTSGKYTTAKDLSGNGNDWTNAGITGIPQTTNESVQYPDVANNQMVSLPSVSVFDNSSGNGARMLRCANVMTGLTDWTVVTLCKIKNWITDLNTRYFYHMDNGGLVLADQNGGGQFYNGTTTGVLSTGLRVASDLSLWKVVIQSYKAPANGNTSRHFIMVNGVPQVIGSNSLGVIDTDPASVNYQWAVATRDYAARTDYAHLSIGTTNPLSLTTGFAYPCNVVKTIGLYNRAISYTEAQKITDYLLSTVYKSAPPFMRILHVIGDSLHQRNGTLLCENGYYWSDLAAVKNAATLFVNSAEGGNSIEIQAVRTLTIAANMARHRYFKQMAANIMIGTNNPSDDGPTRWTKVKTLLNNLLLSGMPKYVNVGTLLACGTSAGHPDVSRSNGNASYNTIMRAGMQPGGDFHDANASIVCGILDYAASIPSSFTVPVAVLDPATDASTYATTVGTTTPADSTNAANYHYKDSLHPQDIIRPNGTAPVYASIGMYEAIKNLVDSQLWV